MKTARLLLAALVASSTLAIVAPLRAAETPAAVIERAREFLGGDKALQKVNSLHYTGTIETKIEGLDNPATAEPVKNDMELIFQRPLDYRMKRTDKSGSAETVGLTGYDAWTLVEIPGQTPRLIMADPPRIWSLQASAFESLNFYSGIETRRGSATVKGEATVDGIPAVKLAFLHPGNVEIVRVFDKKTGRLLQTELTDNVVMREEGEQIVDGIRFPLRVISISKKGPPEKPVVTTTVITLAKVTVNEKFDPAMFKMPSWYRQ